MIRGHIPQPPKQVLGVCTMPEAEVKESERTFVTKGVCFVFLKFRMT